MKKREAGQVALEFVVVSLLYALLFVGIVSMGVVMMRGHQLTQVAREGARAASLTQNIKSAQGKASVTNKMKDLLQEFGIPAAQVTLTIRPVDLNGDGNIDVVDVTVDQRVQNIIGVSLIPGLGNLRLKTTISMPYLAGTG